MPFFDSTRSLTLAANLVLPAYGALLDLLDPLDTVLYEIKHITMIRGMRQSRPTIIVPPLPVHRLLRVQVVVFERGGSFIRLLHLAEVRRLLRSLG